MAALVRPTYGARVSSREDLNGNRSPVIRYEPNPGQGDTSIVLELEPQDARQLARALNKHANFIKPLPRRKKR